MQSRSHKKRDRNSHSSVLAAERARETERDECRMAKKEHIRSINFYAKLPPSSRCLFHNLQAELCLLSLAVCLFGRSLACSLSSRFSAV
jgi:hypothetical protein